MIIVMNGKTDDADVEKIVKKLNEMGHEVHIIRGERRIVLGVIGDVENLASVPFYAFKGVEEIIRIMKPYKLASREFKDFDTIIFSRCNYWGKRSNSNGRALRCRKRETDI